jgi:hypothetical protein
LRRIASVLASLASVHEMHERARMLFRAARAKGAGLVHEKLHRNPL